MGNGGPAAGEESYYNQSIDFATQLSQYYCNRTAMIGLSPFNEPNVRPWPCTVTEPGQSVTLLNIWIAIYESDSVKLILFAPCSLPC